MEQHPVVKVVFSDGRGQFEDFFLSEVLAYHFGKEPLNDQGSYKGRVLEHNKFISLR